MYLKAASVATGYNDERDTEYLFSSFRFFHAPGLLLVSRQALINIAHRQEL